MSQGRACQCGEHRKPIKERRWIVLQRNQRCSAFDGYRPMFSDYSAVQCHVCGNVWRTKADFVLSLRDGKNLYDLSEGARKALERPANYADLPADEQWAIDKRLGILDWDGK